MSKNLITGGFGVLGTNLARRLRKDGEEVVLFDIYSDSRLIPDIKDQVAIVQGDVSDWNSVFRVVGENDIDCIYHLSTLMVDACEANPQRGYATNVNGFYYLMEAARLFGVKSFIYSSSIAAAPLLSQNNEILPPPNLYSMTKCWGEWMGLYYHKRFHVNFRAATMGGIVGPGRYAGVNRWTKAIIQEPALGRAYKCDVEEEWMGGLIYVKDAAWALVDLKRAEDSKLTKRIYDLKRIMITAKEVAIAVKKVLPEAKIEFGTPETNPLRKHFVQREKGHLRNTDENTSIKDWGHYLRYDLNTMVEDMIHEIQKNKTVWQDIIPAVEASSQ